MTMQKNLIVYLFTIAITIFSIAICVFFTYDPFSLSIKFNSNDFLLASVVFYLIIMFAFVGLFCLINNIARRKIFKIFIYSLVAMIYTIALLLIGLLGILLSVHGPDYLAYASLIYTILALILLWKKYLSWVIIPEQIRSVSIIISGSCLLLIGIALLCLAELIYFFMYHS